MPASIFSGISNRGQLNKLNTILTMENYSLSKLFFKLTFLLAAVSATPEIVNAQLAAGTQQINAAADSDRGYIVKVGDQAPDDFELVLHNGDKHR